MKPRIAICALAALACCCAPAFAASPWAILKNPVIKRGYGACVQVAANAGVIYWGPQHALWPSGYRGCAELVSAWEKASQEWTDHRWEANHHPERLAIRAAIAALHASGNAPINWAKFKKDMTVDAKKAAQ